MKALYAGSFDPITNGHIDIISQALTIFEKIIVGVAINPDKKYLFSDDDRASLVRRALEGAQLVTKGNIEVLPFYGMTVKYAEFIEADVLIRGLRAVSDFDAEFQMVQFNRQIPPGCNTVFFMPDESNFFLSSTAIRGIAKMGGDVSKFIPRCVNAVIHDQF